MYSLDNVGFEIPVPPRLVITWRDRSVTKPCLNCGVLRRAVAKPFVFYTGVIPCRINLVLPVALLSNPMMLSCNLHGALKLVRAVRAPYLGQLR